MTTGQNPSDAKQRDEQLPKNPYLGSVQQCDQLILLLEKHLLTNIHPPFLKLIKCQYLLKQAFHTNKCTLDGNNGFYSSWKSD